MIPNTSISPVCPVEVYNSGTIQSPNFPGNYSNNVTCDYFLSVAPPYVVRLTFDLFSTEEGQDVVEVRCLNAILV